MKLIQKFLSDPKDDDSEEASIHRELPLFYFLLQQTPRYNQFMLISAPLLIASLHHQQLDLSPIQENRKECSAVVLRGRKITNPSVTTAKYRTISIEIVGTRMYLCFRIFV